MLRHAAIYPEAYKATSFIIDDEAFILTENVSWRLTAAISKAKLSRRKLSKPNSKIFKDNQKVAARCSTPLLVVSYSNVKHQRWLQKLEAKGQ